jgi:hypothetical protein
MSAPALDGGGFDGGTRLRLAACLYAALTFVMAWPLTANPAGTVMWGGPDPNLFMWTLAWDTHAFTSAPLSIFDANIYYPERLTLAYSENLIGSAVLAAPVLWVTGNPVLALNVVALLSCVLCGLGAYLLGRRAGLSQGAALLSGVVFAFSPARFIRLGQLHLTTVQWVPFGLAFLHAYLDGGRRRDLRLAAAFFTLQALTSGHGIVFLGLGMALLLGYRAALGEPLAPARRLRDLGLTGLVLLAPAVLVFLPYRSVQADMGLRRTLENWAINPGSFLASPSYLQRYLLSLVPQARINETAWAFLFPGYLPLALGALGWLLGRHRWTRAAPISGSVECTDGQTGASPGNRGRRWTEAFARWRAARRQDAVAFYGLLTALSFGLAVGPPLSLWPLVYWIPGLNFIRVPSRFTILALLGLAILAGAGLDRLTAKRPARRVLATWLAGALMLSEFAIPLGSDVVPYRVEIPAIDRWLASRPGQFAIAEVPLGDPESSQATEIRHTTYMLHSTAHWQKTVHGYSGMRPALHEELYAQLLRFPDEPSLRALARLGVARVVVHSELYPPGEWAAVRDRIERASAWLTLEAVSGSGRVYALRTPPTGPGS